MGSLCHQQTQVLLFYYCTPSSYFFEIIANNSGLVCTLYAFVFYYSLSYGILPTSAPGQDMAKQYVRVTV
jgi:hypothetical protein